jgi:hypothetical protein
MAALDMDLSGPCGFPRICSLRAHEASCGPCSACGLKHQTFDTAQGGFVIHFMPIWLRELTPNECQNGGDTPLPAARAHSCSETGQHYGHGRHQQWGQPSVVCTDVQTGEHRVLASSWSEQPVVWMAFGL